MYDDKPVYACVCVYVHGSCDLRCSYSTVTRSLISNPWVESSWGWLSVVRGAVLTSSTVWTRRCSQLSVSKFKPSRYVLSAVTLAQRCFLAVAFDHVCTRMRVISACPTLCMCTSSMCMAMSVCVCVCVCVCAMKGWKCMLCRAHRKTMYTCVSLSLCVCVCVCVPAGCSQRGRCLHAVHGQDR